MARNEIDNDDSTNHDDPAVRGVGLLSYTFGHKSDAYSDDGMFGYHDIDKLWHEWSDFHSYVILWRDEMLIWITERLAGGRPRLNGTKSGDLEVAPDGTISMAFDLRNATVADRSDDRALIATIMMPVARVYRGNIAGKDAGIDTNSANAAAVVVPMHTDDVCDEFRAWAKRSIAAYETGAEYPAVSSVPWARGSVVDDAGTWLRYDADRGWRKKRSTKSKQKKKATT